jgi:hypothetical protein
MKDEADFDNITFEENELSFNITSSLTHSTGLTFMLPAIYDNKNIASITVNGNIKHFTVKLVKNSQYAFVTVKGGMNYNIRAAYLN